MFISIVLNTEYMDIASRKMWYLKNLLHCKDNGWILITHEYMKTHFDEVQNAILPSLFDSWEMRPFTAEEVKDVEQYFIPDELFRKIESRFSSRTEFLLHATNNPIEELEECLGTIINNIQESHPQETIEAAIHCLQAFYSVKNVFDLKEIPFINYIFSAIRMPHGYRQTMYYANMGPLFCTNECEKRFRNFCEYKNEVPIFDNRELIAIIGKERTLPLIPLIDYKPKYEVSICGEANSILPHIFCNAKLTDDDITRVYDSMFSKEMIRTRQHPAHLDNIRVDRTSMHNDPAPFILGSKRLAAVCSQVVLKAMLWKRTPIMPMNTIPLSFMCQKDFASEDITPIEFVNFYLFAYLIPAGLMYREDYWKWRMTNPTEKEIYIHHLKYIFAATKLPDSIYAIKDGNTRFKELLKSRNCDKSLTSEILKNDVIGEIDYNAATSRFVVDGRSFWRLNRQVAEGCIESHLTLNSIVKLFEFYPLDDVAGMVKLESLEINGNKVELDSKDYKYMPKVKGHYTFTNPNISDTLSVKCVWRYMTTEEYCRKLK